MTRLLPPSLVALILTFAPPVLDRPDPRPGMPPVGRGAGVAWAQGAPATSAPGDSATRTAVADSSAPDSAADRPSPVEHAAALVARAQQATPETAAVVRAESVPVFLGGREVFRVRAGRDGLSPGERATAIRRRLGAAVGRRAAAADSVHMISTPEGIEVRLGTRFLWLITPDDIEHMGPSELATELATLPDRIHEGLARERAGRRPIGILVSLLLALGLTVAAWFLVRLLATANRRWQAWISDRLARHLRSVHVRGFEVLSGSQMARLVGGLLRRADLVVAALLLYLYVTLVLSLFPWTQGWSWRLVNIGLGGLMEVARSIVAAVPGLLMVGVILIAFRWLIGLSDRFFDSVAAGTVTFGGFHSELALPSKRIARILLWISAVMVAYPHIPGATSRAVQGVSLLIGLMVSIGSTGFVGNIIAGILLTYSRSFRTGDRVRIGEHEGDVTSLGFFATKLRTIRNEELTLPNGLVAASAVVNYTRLADEQGLVLHTEVTIGYDVDWRRVHAMLIEAAGRVAGVEKEPAPWVFQRSLNDFHVSYELDCVTRLSHDQKRLYSELHQEIQDVFAREGVEILSPGYQALRDANSPVLPPQPAGPRAAPSGFRVRPPGS